MTVSTFLRLGALTIFSAVLALAADISGAWVGQMAGPGGGDGFALSYTFKQEGMALTGTVAGPQGDPIAISDGKVEGDKVTFTINFNGMIFRHEGTISGEEIKMTMKSDGGDFPGGSFTIRKAKA